MEYINKFKLSKTAGRCSRVKESFPLHTNSTVKISLCGTGFVRSDGQVFLRIFPFLHGSIYPSMYFISSSGIFSFVIAIHCGLDGTGIESR